MKIDKKDLGKVKEVRKSQRKKLLSPDRFEPKNLNVTLRELFRYQKEKEKKDVKTSN